MCMLPLLSSSGGEVIPRQHQPARKQTKPAAGSRPVARVRTSTYARAQQRKGELRAEPDTDRRSRRQGSHGSMRTCAAPNLSRRREAPARERDEKVNARGSTRGGRANFQLHRSVACACIGACMVASLGIPGARARIACSWVGKLVWLPVFRPLAKL
jgi:hypothetical protein